MNESCHTHECVTSYSGMSHVTQSSASFHPLLASLMAMLAKNDKYKELLASDTVAGAYTCGYIYISKYMYVYIYIHIHKYKELLASDTVTGA